MAFDLFTLADEATARIEKLVEKRSVGDNEWSNEFCRSLNVIDKVLRGSYNLIAEIEAKKTGGKVAESLAGEYFPAVSADTRYLPAEILQLPKPYKSGLLLTKADDPQYERILAIRQRMGEALHRASNVMRDAGESDNSVETVRLLVSTIGTLLTAYGIRSKQFSNAQNAYSGMMSSKKMYEGQRKHHRSIFMAAASVHHQNRLTTLAYYRVRSALDDKLIGNMLDFTLSPFTRIRRSAQSTLETIAKVYRGTWVLCFPTLFDALQPGSDPDRMKGALYVLRYNHVGIPRISRDWRQLLELVECLLGAHHENKASVQALLSKATEELISSIKEPESFDLDVGLTGVDTAANELASRTRYQPSADVVRKTHAGIIDMTKKQDEEWDKFVDRVIEIARTPGLNWRYALWASKLLLSVMRRDRPTDVRLARFFAQSVRNAHPRIRDYGILWVECFDLR
jgi:proteasome activator subunit 4